MGMAKRTMADVITEARERQRDSERQFVIDTDRLVKPPEFGPAISYQDDDIRIS